MQLLVICFSLTILLCGTAAHNHDSEKGVQLGDNDLIIKPEGIRCPVWAVSYNAIWLDCRLNTDGLEFTLGNSPLQSGNENGKLYLKLGQQSSIPEIRQYKLMVKRRGQDAGSLNISPKMVPKPTVLTELSRLGYGVRSGNVTILNSKTIYIPDFSYDGRAPDAFFWVGSGQPSHEGRMIPDENGSTAILGAYNKKSVILHLPNDITVEDIDYLSVWCRDYKHDFGNVRIPSDVMVPPAFYMPLVADYSKMAISAIDGTEMLHFDSIAGQGSSKDSGATLDIISVYFVLLPALLILYK